MRRVFPGASRYQTGDIFGMSRAISRGIIIHRPAEYLRRPQPVLLYACVGLQGDIFRLDAGFRLHQPGGVIRAAEHGVDPIQRRLLRAAVFGQGQRFQLPAGLDLLDDGKIGVAEAVDGLLVVAHDKQLAGFQRQGMPGLPANIGIRFGRQVKSDFGLQRVGVLELVNQDAGVFLPAVSAGAGIVPQQVPRPDQQVVKSGDAFSLAPRFVANGKALAQVVEERKQRRNPYLILESPSNLTKVAPYLRGGAIPIPTGSDVTVIVHRRACF